MGVPAKRNTPHRKVRRARRYLPELYRMLERYPELENITVQVRICSRSPSESAGVFGQESCKSSTLLE